MTVNDSLSIEWEYCAMYRMSLFIRKSKSIYDYFNSSSVVNKTGVYFMKVSDF